MAMQNPETVKSRPYLRWILMEEKYKRVSKGNPPKSLRQYSNFQYLHDYSGVVLDTENVPIYVPSNSETPGWHVMHSTDGSNQLLETALRVSKETHDHRTHARCLGELICRSSEPEPLILDLSQLLKSTGDMMGYIRVLLSRYMLATDEDACAALYLDLKKQSYIRHQDYPLLGWCRAVIEESLSHSVSHSHLDESILELAGSISVDLPVTFHSLLLQRGFRKSQVRETEDLIRGNPLIWGSHWSDPTLPTLSHEKSSYLTRKLSEDQLPGFMAKDTPPGTDLASSRKYTRSKELKRINEEPAENSKNATYQVKDPLFRPSSRHTIVRRHHARQNTTTDTANISNNSSNNSSGDEVPWAKTYSDEYHFESDKQSRRNRAGKNLGKKDKGKSRKVQPPAQTLALHKSPKLHND